MLLQSCQGASSEYVSIANRRAPPKNDQSSGEWSRRTDHCALAKYIVWHV